jgi:predicted nucleic acid-binding protein
MVTIVSDSTTIITLLNIQRVDILENIFDEVYIPKTVYDEVVIEEDVILKSSFFVKKEIEDKVFCKLLSRSLDTGESEAIVLAKEMELSLIIDEKKGRKIASNLGINIMGLLGLLLLNYKKGHLPEDEVLKVYNSAKEASFRVGQKVEEQFFYLLDLSIAERRLSENNIQADDFFDD